MIETKQSDGSWPWKITYFLSLRGHNLSGKHWVFDATAEISKEDRY